VAIDAMIARGEAPGPRLPAAEALLLVQSDGPDAGADVEHYAAIARAHGATLVETADDPARADALMELRRLLHPALRSLRGAVLNEDVSVPRAQLPALLEGIQRLAVDLDVTIVTGGHLGDGNLHPFLAYDPADPDDVARSIRAYLAVIDLAVRLGGTATGEHGVGSLKLPAIEAELGPRVVAAQRAIKAALDPQGLLNPGRKY
jgi:glycolate oxidase